MSNNNYYSKNDNWYENRKLKMQAGEAEPPQDNILEILKEAIIDEQEDAEYYGRLIQMTTDRTEKDILRQTQLDELKHNKMFNDIYNKLTGSLPEIEQRHKGISKNLSLEYERSIFSELAAVELYRKIYFAFLNTEIRDMLYEIITDEQSHSTKMTYLFAKNKSL